MRRIKFEKGTNKSTVNNVTAVAWATNRRGHNSWKGDNVAKDITEYLEQHHVVLSPQQHIGYTLKWLEEAGYAKRVTTRQRRMVFFQFDDDVILTGMEPLFDKDEGRLVTVNNPQPITQSLLPPTPEQVTKPPLHRFVEFVEALDKWADINPDGYVQWVDTVIPWLKSQA